jgi:peptide/nickel transport system ATP-binding protein
MSERRDFGPVGNSPTPAVVVRDLTVSIAYTGAPVVSDIAFMIGEGRTMGLVGESGSGKSTAAVALLGVARHGLKITSGSISIAGVEVLALSEPELQKCRGSLVSYVPQDPAASLNPAHRVGEQLREALLVHGVDNAEDRVRELLNDVRLSDTKQLRRSYPHQLSGGQQQRVVIAIAFACRPRLIVLDEPTTGLDVTTQRHVLETVRDLSATYKCSAVYVSHDLACVAQIADDTAVMYAGRIVEHGPSSQLFAEPRHPYTAGLLAGVPSPDRTQRLVGIVGKPPRPGRWPKGCPYADRCGRADADCRDSIPSLVPSDDARAVRCLHPIANPTPNPVTGDLAVRPTADLGTNLSVLDLRARYGGTEVLHGVSFDVPAGCCTAIVGESGSGKTTLARCLVGLHSAWTGDVKLGDTALKRAAARRTKAQLRQMQYVFQNPFGSLNPTMTVAENVEEPLRHFEKLSRKERRQRAIDALNYAHLGPEFADVPPARISGGERQRAAVARALIVNPEILVCDEITSALDVSVQALLVETLRGLQTARGLSMVFITHNLGLVRSIADRVIVLERGHIVEDGDVAQVLERPQHPYTKQLLEDIPRLPRTSSFAAA